MKSDWRNKAKQRVKQKKQGSTFKLVVGRNCFRILPNAKGTDYAPYHEYLVHREIGPKHKMLTCGKEIDEIGNKVGDCWLCDTVIPKLEKSGSRIKRSIAAAIVAKEQMVCQVAVYDSDAERLSGPLTWFVSTGGPKSLSVAIMGLLASSKRSFDDPKRGYNLNIERTGTGQKDTRYENIEADEEKSKVPKSIINAIKPFEEVVQEYDEDKQRAAYYGREESDNFGDDEDDEDDDVKTKKGKKKLSSADEKELKKKKKKDADEDEEEDEDEEDEEEEDEDDGDDEDEDEDDDDDVDSEIKKLKKKLADLEKKKKSKKKSKKDDDEDEEEDDDEDEDEDESDDDDEDEEDEKPSKKAKGKKGKKK